MKRFDGIFQQPRPRQIRVQSVPVAPPPPAPSRPAKSRGQAGYLVGIIAAAASYLALAPYAPNWLYAWQHRADVSASLTSVATTPPSTSPDTTTLSAFPYYGKNMLSIPKIEVFSEILEGVNETSLERGLWRRPNSSTPDEGGNTVIAAHRFKYTTGPNTFYHLDKVAVGDQISLTWRGKTYGYTVRELHIVQATDTWIEAATEQPTLTLYTCTPLWTSSKRLVVRAELTNPPTNEPVESVEPSTQP